MIANTMHFAKLRTAFIIYTMNYILVMQGVQGKTDITVENVQSCTGLDKKIESPMRNLQFQKVNRTAKALSFDVTIKRNIDKNVASKTTLEKLGNTGWVEVPFMPIVPDACNIYLKHFGDTFTKLMDNMGVKNPNKCPIPPGDYKLRNFIFDIPDKNTIPFKGKFRFTIAFVDVKADIYVACLRTIINAV